MVGDWLKLHRKIKDSSVFASPELLKLWILCLCKANWRDSWASVEGVTKPILVRRGQFLTGRYELHADYYPKRKPTNKSPKTVWRWLQILENLGNLTIKTSNKYSLVTICHYATYQDVDLENVQQNDQQMTNSCPTDDQQMTTSEESKEIEEGKEVGTKQTNRKRFEPPTVDQVAAYCRERGNNVNPQKFVDYYQTRGWKLKGGTGMKDWKAAIRATWEDDNQQNNSKPARLF